MSETLAVSTPSATATAAGRTPTTVVVRTVLFALGLLAAMRIGDALAGVLVPSVGQTVGSGTGELALVALLHALVLAPIALQARVGGWRLALAVAGGYATIVWALNQIEAAVFIGALMPDGFAMATAISQGLVAVAAGTLAAVLLGPRPPALARHHPPLLARSLPAHRWALRVGAVSVVYFLLYFVAGIFIALRDPQLQAFYDRVGMPAPEVVAALQLGRGVIWTAVVALLLWALDASRRRAALTVALACSILMASALIPENPFLPSEIQTTHFVEIASSNFVFGLLASWILTRRG